MDKGRISTRYAKAMYEFALERKEETILYEELKQMTQYFFSFRALQHVMDNPVISAEDKKKLLITAAGIQVSHSFLQSLDLIVKNNRLSYIYSISLVYQDFFREQKGIIVVQLTTAQHASFFKDQKERLEKLIQTKFHKKTDFISKVDPSIIGGFILELDSNLLDASIKNQLNQIKSELLKENKKVM